VYTAVWQYGIVVVVATYLTTYLQRIYILKRFRFEFVFFQILCEGSMAIYEINDTPESHVSRDIMPMESRISRDNQSLRDWLILREYMTSLQYVIEAFGYLKTKR